ncbi:MAG: hypothetical protein ACKOXO_00530 [Cyanobium sp.]
MSLPPPRLPLLGGALLLLFLGGGLALAQSSPEPNAPTGRRSLTPAQQQQLFPGLRSLAQQSLRTRIAILQRQQQCVTSATAHAALRQCHLEERNAVQAERRQYREGLRRLLERLRTGAAPQRPEERSPAGRPSPTGVSI